jgi:hypothetical protein
MELLIGIAVVKIQRFWRQTGAVGRAVEEVMALKRERSNPFVPCSTLHEVRRFTVPGAGMRADAHVVGPYRCW